MKLYKYRSLENLWHTLDIVINNRLFCAKWSDLNDPLEGRYELFLEKENGTDAISLTEKIERYKSDFRISSLSSNPNNFLMWSHYANGHKGVAIEIEFEEENLSLSQVTYTPFSSVFTKDIEDERGLHHIFTGKGEEWAYEEEYRIITRENYYNLLEPVKKILLGFLVSEQREHILRQALPGVEIIRMEMDKNQGCVTVKESEN
jgi:hypothetical protein